MNSGHPVATALRLIPVCGYLSLIASGGAQEAPKQINVEIPGFKERIASYIKLHKKAERGLSHLKPTASAEPIIQREGELASRIRQARQNAKQGEIFTSPISAELRRRIALVMQGQQSARIKSSLKNSEPVSLHLRVNDAYPHAVPLQSMPATLLMSLPVLPKELEYRILWPDLVLRDVEANLIVDFIPNALP